MRADPAAQTVRVGLRTLADVGGGAHPLCMTTIDTETRVQHVELQGGGSVELRVDLDEDRITVSAWDEHGNRVGVAFCNRAASARPHEAEIEVTPMHRRRGIGAQLLHLLTTTAAEQGVPMLTWTTPADDVAVRHLTDARDVVCARRVADGRAKSTIFVPAA